MSDHDFLDPEPDEGQDSVADPEAGECQDQVNEVQLGDALANDSQLRENLAKIDETINNEAPGTSGWRLIDLMGRCKSWASTGWSVTKKVVEWGIQRFTDVETRRIRARAEATKTRTIAKAEAKKIEAEAKILEAEAAIRLAQGTAVAEEIRAETSRKDELLKELKKRGIDWRSEIDGEILRVVVTKEITDQTKKPS